MSAGKGDTRRPSRVSRQEYERRWEKAFGGGRVRRMEPEEARENVSPEMREFADRMDYELAGLEMRVGLTEELLQKVREPPRTAFHQLLQQRARRERGGQ